MKKKNYVIYLLAGPNSRDRYVGISNQDVVSRFRYHKEMASTDKVNPIHLAMHKRDRDWTFLVLENTNNPERVNLYIKTYNSVEEGLNQTYKTAGNRHLP